MQLSFFASLIQQDPPLSKGSKHSEWSVLLPLLPPDGYEIIKVQLEETPVQIRVVKHRVSKSGDFRAPFKGKPARITINGNLNPFAFLITLVHELAHHQVWLRHEQKRQTFSIRRVKRPLPHGKEWKSEFRHLMQPFLVSGIFPFEVYHALSKYLENPKASSSADHQLSRILKNFDPPDQTVRLEELPPEAIFTLHGRRTFLKKEKMRTRYRCICMKTNRIYLVSAGAPVVPA